MKQLSLILVVASSLAFTAGCGTKNYVRNTATPIINKTNELMTVKRHQQRKRFRTGDLLLCVSFRLLSAKSRLP